jgi:hypothetical protein
VKNIREWPKTSGSPKAGDAIGIFTVGVFHVFGELFCLIGEVKFSELSNFQFVLMCFLREESHFKEDYECRAFLRNKGTYFKA